MLTILKQNDSIKFDNLIEKNLVVLSQEELKVLSGGAEGKVKWGNDVVPPKK